MKEKELYPIGSRREHNKKNSPKGDRPTESKKQWKRTETTISQPCPVKDCGGTMVRKSSDSSPYMECTSCGFRSRAN